MFSYQGFSQTTHAVQVRINQGPECPVVNGLDEADLFTVFPNPATSSFTIEAEVADATIKLIDSQGKAVRSALLRNHKLQVDADGLKPGIYLLYLDYEGGTRHIKISIQ